MDIKEALIRLRHTPEFKAVIKAAPKRPFLRTASPDITPDQAASQVLFDSGMQRGYDLLMNYLRGTDEWQSRNK
jgi:hypothetical protein